MSQLPGTWEKQTQRKHRTGLQVISISTAANLKSGTQSELTGPVRGYASIEENPQKQACKGATANIKVIGHRRQNNCDDIQEDKIEDL